MAPLDIEGISAIDVHVHLEHTGTLVEADKAAKRYFGATAEPATGPLSPSTIVPGGWPASCSPWTSG